MDLSQGSDSKFRTILVAARRARQLQLGARPLIQSGAKKMINVAQEEVRLGLVPYEVLETKKDKEKLKGRNSPKK